MKIGFVSAILPELDLEDVVDFASSNEFQCIEVMCWPSGKAERRYAGVTHIDMEKSDENYVNNVNNTFKKHHLEISALGYYPNPLDPDLEKRQIYCEHIKKMISRASDFGVDTITTFIGRDPNLSVSENLKRVGEIWPDIIRFAEEKNVKVAIENCPMLFTEDEWPGGKNLMTTPKIWRQIFEMIPSDHFGLNYDPSHFIWQQMDYIKPIYEFSDKIFHVHIKDLKILKDKLDEVGIMATPLEYCLPKLPGLGDVNWGKFMSALTDIGYHGHVSIEVEDKAFENSLEDRYTALNQAHRFISQYL